MEFSEENIFHILLHGGNARSLAMEAVHDAKSGNWQAARQKIGQAEAEIRKAHRIQTAWIQQEAGGERKEVTLLLVHAQDHLMNAITVKDLAVELIDLYKRMSSAGGAKG